ncbi:DUF4932 domain-containing protein [Rubrivirga sp.]|uniref:DUF4932 domain-containing protein n=1 Tax=Rubrivirga sp. TaxID=1885344 RepID=UPI003C72C73C
MPFRCFALASILAASASAQAPVEWAPSTESVRLLVPEADWSIDLEVADFDSVEVFNVPLVNDGKRLSVALISAGDTLRVVPDAPGIYRVRLAREGRRIALDFTFWSPAEASFSDDQIGTSRIAAPEVYELVNVAFALTPTGRDTTNVLVWRSGPYYDRVRAHFLPFTEHPAIIALEAVLRDDDYVPVRSNALAFRFEDDRIVPDTTYASLGRGHARLTTLLPDLEAFATESGFRAFYDENRPYYVESVRDMEDLLPVHQMWTWLEAEFPARSQSYLTVFSPLTYGTHNAMTVEDGDHRQSIAFIPGPSVLEDGESIVGTGSASWRQVEMSRMAFTEYDHTYVNPAMDPHIRAIQDAMPDLDVWNQISVYRSAYETFAEYMTWAVFLLYIDDHYPAETAAETRDGVTRFMERNRGFVQFGAFEGALADRYARRAPGETVADLIPDLAAWMADRATDEQR